MCVCNKPEWRRLHYHQKHINVEIPSTPSRPRPVFKHCSGDCLYPDKDITYNRKLKFICQGHCSLLSHKAPSLGTQQPNTLTHIRVTFLLFLLLYPLYGLIPVLGGTESSIFLSAVSGATRLTSARGSSARDRVPPPPGLKPLMSVSNTARVLAPHTPFKNHPLHYYAQL